MEKSTLEVLQLIYDLQFTGRFDTLYNKVSCIENVPEILLVVELGYESDTINRELRLLETREMVKKGYSRTDFIIKEYKRDDGAVVSIDSSNPKFLRLLDNSDMILCHAKLTKDELVRGRAEPTYLSNPKITTYTITAKGIEALNNDNATTSLKRQGATKITKDEANMRARDLLRRNPKFAHKTQKEWAAAIGCSSALVNNLPTRKAIMEKRKTESPVQPRVTSINKMTFDLNGRGDPELEKLIGEQTTDYEPSPLADDPIGKPPSKTKQHKRL